MNIQTKQLLESGGFQIIEGDWNFKYRTGTFIRHPDGRLNPYYEKLSDIPALPNGTEFDLNRAAMPYDEIYGRSTDVKNTMAITHAEFELDANLSPTIPLWVGYLLISIVLLAIVICIYFILNPPAQQPPCGTEAKIIDVSECSKIIIMPNCDSRTFDACTDQWMEDSWHTWEPPAGWLTWLVIGVVAIAAIIIIPKVLEKRKYPPSPPPPPYLP